MRGRFEEGSEKGKWRSEVSLSGKNDEIALHNRQALNCDYGCLSKLCEKFTMLPKKSPSYRRSR